MDTAKDHLIEGKIHPLLPWNM